MNFPEIFHMFAVFSGLLLQNNSWWGQALTEAYSGKHWQMWDWGGWKMLSDNSFSHFHAKTWTTGPKSTLPYPIVMVTVGAPRTQQPFPSIWFCFQLLLGCRKTVHSETLFSQCFFCQPLLLPPCTVPCKIVLASPADLDTCPNHFHLRFFTVVNTSS